MKHIYLIIFNFFLFATTYAQSNWTVVPSPNFSEQSTFLRGISGTSDTDIWAVGNYEVLQPGGMIFSEMLALHFDGTNWIKFPVPEHNDENPSLILWDVETISPDNVWAVGSQLLHFDGDGWKQHSFTLPGPLSAIDALSPNDIWAVGRQGGPVPNPALAIHYNGSSWTEVPVPIVGERYQELKAVDGIANDDVWAVGWWAHTRGAFMPMAMHWNGNGWNNIELPATIMDSNGELESVLMIASNDVWATGTDLTTGENIVIHWDGTSWSEVPHNGSVGAIVGSGSDNIFTVGQDISHWDGENWQIIDDLNFSSYPTLAETTILPTGEIWAVGTTMHEGNDALNPIYNTLVMRSNSGQVSAEPDVQLPPDNFSIKMKDETCKNMNNGQLIIEAKEAHTYVVNFNNQTSSFTNTKSISFEHLAPDTYHLEIMVEGKEHTRQSFEFEIKPGMTFDAQMSVISSAVNKQLQVQVLEGTAPFAVKINGEILREFYHNSFSIPVRKGDIVEINSSLSCEGSLNMNIEPEGKVTLYPNPVTTIAQIILPFPQLKSIPVEVYNSMGQRIISSNLPVQKNAQIDLDLSFLPAGIYYARIKLEKPQTLKIIKR